MDGDGIQDYLDRLLDALEGIRADLAGAEAVPPPQPDTGPLIAAIVLAALAALIGLAALALAWRALAVFSGLRERGLAAGSTAERAEFGASVRRYSELLGVAAVTGRPPSRGETATALRSALEHRLGTVNHPGAAELLEEVADSRAGLADLSRDARTSANGLAAMSVEWSIDRWIHDPDAWLRDHRERTRLRALAHRGAAASAEDVVDGDTRLT